MSQANFPASPSLNQNVPTKAIPTLVPLTLRLRFSYHAGRGCGHAELLRRVRWSSVPLAGQSLILSGASWITGSDWTVDDVIYIVEEDGSVEINVELEPRDIAQDLLKVGAKNCVIQQRYRNMLRVQLTRLNRDGFLQTLQAFRDCGWDLDEAGHNAWHSGDGNCDELTEEVFAGLALELPPADTVDCFESDDDDDDEFDDEDDDDE